MQPQPSKNTKVKGSDAAPAGSAVAAVAGEAKDASATEAKAPAVPRSRGPKGTTEDAVITLLSTSNPKRPNSKAHAIFSNYVNGMTIKAFADKVDLLGEGKGKGESTTALVYDAKHGFISIAGYDPGAIVVPKAKAPPKPKAEKVAKVKDKTADGETKNETMD